MVTEYLPGKYNFFFSNHIEIKPQDISAVHAELNEKSLGKLGEYQGSSFLLFFLKRKVLTLAKKQEVFAQLNTLRY